MKEKQISKFVIDSLNETKTPLKKVIESLNDQVSRNKLKQIEDIINEVVQNCRSQISDHNGKLFNPNDLHTFLELGLIKQLELDINYVTHSDEESDVDFYKIKNTLLNMFCDLKDLNAKNIEIHYFKNKICIFNDSSFFQVKHERLIENNTMKMFFSESTIEALRTLYSEYIKDGVKFNFKAFHSPFNNEFAIVLKF